MISNKSPQASEPRRRSPFLNWMHRKASGGGATQAFSLGRSKAKIWDENSKRVSFAEVVGIDESVAELREVVDFLSNRDKYAKIGPVALDEAGGGGEFAWASARHCGESTAETVDAEVKRLVEEGFGCAQRIIREKRDAFEKTAEILLQREVLESDALRETLEACGVKMSKPRSAAAFDLPVSVAARREEGQA